jgi:CubicO group peptidase (beta-lactamase class C family)
MFCAARSNARSKDDVHLVSIRESEAAVSKLQVEVEPESFGFSTERLARIKPHFDEYVEDRRLAGWLATISRGGELVWSDKGGHRDREKALDVEDDTIWRIYSMTKPVTAVAVMMLYEEGLFDLSSPAGKWIDALREPRVFSGGTSMSPETVPATESVRIHHLLTHMSGLTYGFQYIHPVDAIYRQKGYDFAFKKGATLEEAVDDWCSSPLVFQPGSRWNYSVAFDVLGRLIEIWSGQPLDVFMKERIFDPLGMGDTEWWCPPEKVDRLAMLYVPVNREAMAYEPFAKAALHPPGLLGGGGGLLSTAYDYNRFMGMLLGGGELDGVRLLSNRTVDLMTQNLLPGDVDLETMAMDSFSESTYAGEGFGLGMSVMIDRRKNKSLCTEGSFAWGGAASTAFWVDPVEDLTVAFYTQLLPSGTYPIRRDLRQLVYQALVD